MSVQETFGPVPAPPLASGCRECGFNTTYETSNSLPGHERLEEPNGVIAEAMPPFRYHFYRCTAEPAHQATVVSDWLVEGVWQERWRDDPCGHGTSTGPSGHWVPAQFAE